VSCEPRTLRDGAALWRFPFVVASAVAWALGALAVLLTSIGLYGLVAFSVVQRLPEIGVRLALGATPRQVLGLITGRAARSVALGLALGFLLCLPLSWIAARLFGLSAPLDLPALAGAPLLLAAVALAAALAPARRALGVDPVASLRRE
jgi:ABC-type antimicrobial peptide transport system permease subunit